MSWLGRICTYEALLKAECSPHSPFCYQPNFVDYGTNQKVGDIGFAPMQTPKCQNIYHIPLFVIGLIFQLRKSPQISNLGK